MNSQKPRDSNSSGIVTRQVHNENKDQCLQHQPTTIFRMKENGCMLKEKQNFCPCDARQNSQLLQRNWRATQVPLGKEMHLAPDPKSTNSSASLNFSSRERHEIGRGRGYKNRKNYQRKKIIAAETTMPQNPNSQERINESTAATPESARRQ
jgi:hypothetical protein